MFLNGCRFGCSPIVYLMKFGNFRDYNELKPRENSNESHGCRQGYETIRSGLASQFAGSADSFFVSRKVRDRRAFCGNERASIVIPLRSSTKTTGCLPASTKAMTATGCHSCQGRMCVSETVTFNFFLIWRKLCNAILSVGSRFMSMT